MYSILFGIFILRVVFGLIFAGHGAQKLFGWFGGGGLNGTGKMFGSLDMHPPALWAFIAGAAEFLGGLGLALGLYTPISAALIIGTMTMAIIKVHWRNGLWNTRGGVEYPLINLLLAAFLGLFGPGLYSLDTALNLFYPQPWTFTAAVFVVWLGVLAGLLSGSIFVTTESRSGRANQDQSQEPGA